MNSSGFLKEHSTPLAWILRVQDWVVLILTGWVAFDLSLHTWALPPNYIFPIILASLLSFWLYPAFSVYRTWRGVSKLDEIRVIFLSWTSVFIALSIIAILTKTASQYSRLWFGYWYCSGLLGLVSARMVIRRFLDYIRSIGLNQRRILIVGAGELGKQVAIKIRAAPWTGLHVAGFLSDINSANLPAYISDIEILGALDSVDSIIQENGIDQVWIAMSIQNVEKIHKTLHKIESSTVEVRYVPDIIAFRLLNHSVTEINGLPVINISATPMEGVNRFIKAIEDRLFAALILILVSPLIVLISIGVKLTSPGPILYRQERVSWNGEAFKMLKFRSMPVDTEKNGVEWGNGKHKALNPFGRFLRKSSLDELPQFINVLKGDMSIVGPRPERSVFVEQFRHQIPGYMQKHMVKAGITGWAQINGWRGDTDLVKRIEYDLYYIENWSLWLDMKIIFLTVCGGMLNKNAY